MDTSMDENVQFPAPFSRARAYWRMESAQDIMRATERLVARGQMTQREHERVVEQAWRAQLDLDDEILKGFLKRYCPASDRIARYPTL